MVRIMIHFMNKTHGKRACDFSYSNDNICFDCLGYGTSIMHHDVDVKSNGIVALIDVMVHTLVCKS